MASVHGDVREIRSLLEANSFDCVISNPPYFPGGPASRTTPIARREDLCSARELMAAASFTLKFGGDFFLVHRPERLAELISAGSEFALELKRLRLVRHRQDGPVSLILLQFRKGAKPGLHWEELSLRFSDGSPTPAYREIYHI